jgi:membrane protein implicated in regulation of membrane protease activity
MIVPEIYQFTLIFALFLLALEIVLPSFFFASLAVGALVLAFLHYVIGDYNISRDLFILAITTSVSFLGFRKFFRKPQDQITKDKDVNRY